MNNHDLFEKWWPRVRDVLAFGLGIFLLTKPSLSATQATVGAACVGVTVTSVTRAVIRNGNNKGKK